MSTKQWTNMRYVLVSVLVSVAIYSVSCSVITKDKTEIEKIGEDLIEEIAEDLE